jgi:tRNA1Val (adenine37-N6)-methyltransferase
MKPFHLKQFSINQDKCAMKVTLDACLLGGLCAQFVNQSLWLSDEIPNATLDIGSGTGLLSLMLAQTGLKNIIGVELDPAAAIQAQQNINDSQFKDQITIVQSDIQNYSSEHKFNLIVSNPPFFTDNLKGPNQQRNQARHNDGLSFSDLAISISELLAVQGTAWILLPCDEFSRFEKIATHNSLAILSKYWIKSQQTSSPHRVVFALQHSDSNNIQPFEKTFVIKTHSQADYSPEFKQLLTDYYLKL